MEPELSTSPCLPHVEMFLLPLLNAALFFTVHSSVFLHYTFIVLLGTEKQNLSLRKNETYAALYHLLGAEGAPVCPCSWNLSKLPVEKRTLFPLKILRASSIRLLSEPKHICFHKRIVGCLLTAKCLFWDHLAAWNNVLVETVEMSVLRVFNSYLLRIPNGTNILPKEQNYPDWKCSAVTSREVLKNLAGCGKANEISLGNWAGTTKGCRNFSISSRWRFEFSWEVGKCPLYLKVEWAKFKRCEFWFPNNHLSKTSRLKGELHYVYSASLFKLVKQKPFPREILGDFGNGEVCRWNTNAPELKAGPAKPEVEWEICH